MSDFTFDDVLELKMEKLREIGIKHAEAKRKLATMDHGRKILLAKLMKEKQLNSTTGRMDSVNAQDREARTDHVYQLHIEGLGIAIEEEAKWSWEKKIVEINFETWKTKMISATIEKKRYG